MFLLNQIDLTELPFIVSEMLGISEYAGGVFCILVLFLAVGLPTIVLIQDKMSIGAVLVEGLLLIIFGVSVGWVDFWIILFIGLITTMMIAWKIATIGGD